MSDRIVFWVAVWVFLFGVWPLAHPEHSLSPSNPMGVLDIALHIAALIVLARRWRVKIVRREEA